MQGARAQAAAVWARKVDHAVRGPVASKDTGRAAVALVEVAEDGNGKDEDVAHDEGPQRGEAPHLAPLKGPPQRGAEEIGIGGSLAAPPSHTTVRTGPYTAVRLATRS
jgi:hypothetical protein